MNHIDTMFSITEELGGRLSRKHMLGIQSFLIHVNLEKRYFLKLVLVGCRRN
ncbi:MAG: hypothetical protein CM15mP62_32330 [Rhodospirillaceae bacterium]|nr:MAG: hypothetical protein CM15mP62_32330 [Rhodospirillaceae bacterium]